jgi:hypothetical protein
VVSESADTVRIVARLRSNFAVKHLRSAVRAAQSANHVEQANTEAEFGAWFDELMQLVPVSIVMAGAALEASANELIQDALDGSAGLLPNKGCRQLLNDLKNERSGRDCHIAMERAPSVRGSRSFRLLLRRSAMCPSPQREARGAFGLK